MNGWPSGRKRTPRILTAGCLSATNTFAVVVNEVNVAPILPVIPTQTVLELSLLSVTNTASESNIHSTLGYRLLNPPAGMIIDANGLITWTPRPGTPKDKRSRLDDALQSLRHVSRAASDQCPQGHDLTGAKVLWCKHDILLDRPLSGRTAGWAI